MRLVGWVLALSVAAGQSPGVIEPGRAATPPVFDGRVSASEQTGMVVTMTGGGRVWLARTDDGLYVGIQPGDVGFAHVCVSVNDRVNVLHSSGSLGTATYQMKGIAGTRLMPFTWERPADVRAFLAAHRWTGALPPDSSTDREFLLGPEWTVGGTMRIAVAYGGLGATRRWPTTVTDDCLNGGLLFGEAPPSATFRPAEWAEVRVRSTP